MFSPPPDIFKMQKFFKLNFQTGNLSLWDEPELKPHQGNRGTLKSAN